MPLHVVALYLDADGRAIDPDKGGYPTASDTAEGGRLLDAGRSLHLEWDAIPSAFEVRGSEAPQLLQEAAALEPTPGDPDAWPIAWADQSILAGRRVAFAGLRFALRAPASGDAEAGQNYWDVSGADGGYWCSAEDLKYHQLARAGARLAQLLLAIWPDGNRRAAPVRAEAAADPMAGGGSGYLRPCQVAQLEAWLPPAPVPGSAALADDIARFRAERWILATARGQQAADDDVYDAPLVAARFGEAAGIALTPRQVPTLIKIIRRMQADAGRMVAPVKRPIRDGGRIRPFVAFPKAPSCLAPRDLAGHRQADLEHNHLDQGGSYPSSHALLGMLVGMVLGEALPARANALIERGLAFGDSRMICGFHYYSDVVAGRLVAASLFARLQAEEDFSDDMAALRVELGTAAAIEPVEFDRRPGR
jgi:acid phosphatase (class A)